MKANATMNKITRATLAGLMLCSMALSTGMALNSTTQTVQASQTTNSLPSKVTVQINKKLINGNYQNTPNTGEAIDSLDKMDPLADVPFTAYDVTDLYYTLKAAHPTLSAEDLAAKVTDGWETYRGGAGVVKGQTLSTNPQGLIDFTDLATRNADNKYKAYIFEEGATAANIMKSAPLFVGMPVRNVAGTKFLSTIKIYPKNHGVDKELTNIVPESTSDNKVYSFEVGQDLKYSTDIVIPDGLGDADSKYQSITLEDKMSAKGTTLVGTPVITAGENDENLHSYFVNAGLYTDSNRSGWTDFAGFKYHVNLKSPTSQNALNALLDKIEGKKLTIKYTMRINDEAVPTEDIGNTFYGIFNNGSDQIITDDSQKVETGGHIFYKRDAYDHEHGLANAKFKFYRLNQQGEKEWAKLNNLTVAGSVYQPKSITWGSQANATELTSGSDGKLQINGLGSGTYYLYETEAPAGYEITQETTKFTVAAGKDQSGSLVTTNVDNSPVHGELPLTGGTGVAAFLILGTAAMGTAVVYKKRRA